MVAPVLLAGCLQSAGIPARGIDFNIEFIKRFSDQPYFADLKNFLTMGYMVRPTFAPTVFRDVLRFTKKFLMDLDKRHGPTHIGLSVFTNESLDYAQIMCYVIRRWLPHVRIIAGGKGLEVQGSDDSKLHDTWIHHGMVDTVVIGDAESAIIDCIRADKQGTVVALPQTKDDLDRIPLAQWSDYDLKIYGEFSDLVNQDNVENEPYLSVTGSKGCVRQCTFCDVASFWPNFIYRDPDLVAQEIIHNYRNTGIKRFKFTDNLINGSITNYRRMNQVLAESVPGEITYSGYAIFRGRDQMPESDFELAARAGCRHWSVGVESGSERVRYDMKKKFNDHDLDWSVRMLYKYEIDQTWLLIVGYPSETEQDFNQSLDLLSKYRDLRDRILIQVTPTFMLLNNSPLLNNADLARQYGLEHQTRSGAFHNKFWTSTRYVENDYPTRSRRWKRLMMMAQELGYRFGRGMPVQKWLDEINSLDKIYNEQHKKTFPIYPSS